LRTFDFEPQFSLNISKFCLCVLRVVEKGVEDFHGCRKRSPILQIGHGNGGVGVRDGPVVKRDLSTDSGAIEFTGAILKSDSVYI
jgi:hypothetical protein